MEAPSERRLAGRQEVTCTWGGGAEGVAGRGPMRRKSHCSEATLSREPGLICRNRGAGRG